MGAGRSRRTRATASRRCKGKNGAFATSEEAWKNANRMAAQTGTNWHTLSVYKCKGRNSCGKFHIGRKPLPYR
jgi:hypothetical protein